ncbi:MAG: putative Ig domain-containing protein [Nitrospirota bacterium]
MRYHPSDRNIYWTILFSIIATLSLTACGDVSNVSPPPTTPAPAAPGPLAILTSDPLPAGTIHAAYNITLTPNGGTPPYTWSLVPGSPPLPTGLVLTPSTGNIAGIPTAASGTILTNFNVQDSTGQSVQKVLSLMVNVAPTPLGILTTSLPTGSINQPYAVALSPTGGTSPYTWALKSGSTLLPSGLTLTPNGVISGTPTVTGSATHTFTLTDATSLTVETSLTLTISAVPLSITTTSLTQGTANQNYSTTLAATGGTGAYTWGFAGGSPALPNGLTLNTSTGVISGIPTSTSNQTYTFTVTDQTPPTPQTATMTLPLIIGAVPPTINALTLPTGTVNQPYPNTQLTATGGALPYTWSVNPALPNGLTLSPSSGVISGTPLSGSNGVTSHTFTVADSTVPIHQTNSTAPKSLTILPNVTPVTITTTSLPNGTAKQSYTAPLLAASGGTAPYHWSLNSGSTLPQGLSLSANGAITGTPTTSGTTTTTFKVQDSTVPTPQSGTKSLSITINK